MPITVVNNNSLVSALQQTNPITINLPSAVDMSSVALQAVEEAQAAQAGAEAAVVAAGRVAETYASAGYTLWTQQQADWALNPSSAPDYYVDPEAGSDSNSGATAALAFATLAPLEAMASGALTGKTIAIKAGHTYTSYLWTSDDNVTVTRYGFGTNPLGECRDFIAAADWTVNATYSDCYDATVTITTDDLPKFMGNVWRNEMILEQKSSLSACATSEGTAYVSGWTTSTTLTVTVNTGGVPPATDEISVSARAAFLQLYGDGCQIIGIDAIGNGTQNGSLVLGFNGKVSFASALDGCRHALYAKPGTVIEDSTFTRGRNDLEAPGSANSVVVHNGTLAGYDFQTRRCTFDGGEGGANYTGPYGHGSLGTEVYDRVHHDRNTYKNMELGHVLCAQSMIVSNPDVKYVDMFIQAGGGVGDCTVYGLNDGARINRLIEFSVGGKFRSRLNGSVSIPALGAGYYRAAASVDAEIYVDGDNLTVEAEEALSSPSHIAFMYRGKLDMRNCVIGPALACPVDEVIRVGTTATSTVVSKNNVFPVGSKFQVNGTNYANLDDFQAAGFDTGSTEAALPAALYSDTFNRPNENLEVDDMWTRIGGTAGHVAVASNALSVSGTSQGLLHVPAMPTQNMWVKATVKGVPAFGGPLLVVQAKDDTNWVGLRWSASGYQVQICADGSFVGPGAISGVTAAVDDQVILAIRDGIIYVYQKPTGDSSYTRIGVYQLSYYTAAMFNTYRRAGVVSRNSTASPWIDNFSCGQL